MGITKAFTILFLILCKFKITNCFATLIYLKMMPELLFLEFFNTYRNAIKRKTIGVPG